MKRKPPPYRKYEWMAGISLLLLLTFLSIWTKSIYHNEKNDLRQKNHLVFANAIREAEDALLKNTLVRIELDDSNVMDKSIILIDHQHDSIHRPNIDSILRVTKKFYGKKHAHHSIALTLEKDSTFFMRKDSEEVWINKTRPLEISGMLSLYQHTISSDIPGDSALLDSFLTSTIKRKLAGFDYAKSPIQIKLIEQSEHPNLSISAFPVGTYVDVANGQTFEAFIPNYRALIFGKIWPHLAFSALLFICICTAFLLTLRAMRSQHRLVKIKNDFVSNMTHELKTPITTVGVALEALSNFDGLSDPVRTKDYIDISQKELSRLSILVDKVMKMTIFEKGVPDLNIEKLDLLAITGEVVSSMRLHVEKYAGRVTLESKGNDFNLDGDRIHLTSVIYNLIDNALKYTDRKPIISIELINHPEEVILSVQDNGIGIDTFHMDKIFDKFYRVTSGNHHDIKGYGLGLSYVANVINKHFGSIRVESSPHQGSKFIIELPRKHAGS